MKYMLPLIVLLCASMLSGADKKSRIEISKAEGYVTDTLVESSNHFIGKAKLSEGYSFLVVRVTYKFFAENGKRLRVYACDLSVQPDGEKGLIPNIGYVSDTGIASLGSGFDMYHSEDDDKKEFTLPLVYPVPKAHKTFTLKFEDTPPAKVTPCEKPKKEAKGNRAFAKCQVVTAKAIDRFLYRQSGYPHDTSRGIVRESKTDQFVEIKIRFFPAQGLGHFSVDNDILAFRCRENGAIYRYLYIYNQVSCLRFSGPPASGSTKGSLRKVYAKLPGFCSEFDVLIRGRTVASGKISRAKE